MLLFIIHSRFSRPLSCNSTNSMDPLHEYTARREHWLTERQKLDRLYIKIGNYRLAVVLAAALLAGLSFWRGALSGWWLLGPRRCSSDWLSAARSTPAAKPSAQRGFGLL